MFKKNERGNLIKEKKMKKKILSYTRKKNEPKFFSILNCFFFKLQTHTHIDMTLQVERNENKKMLASM